MARVAPGDMAVNGWLRWIAPGDRARLAEYLEPVPLRPGATLFDAGEAGQAVMFPLDGVQVSLGLAVPGGGLAECGPVGSEGLVRATGGQWPAVARAVVRVGGPALCMDAARFRDIAEQSAGIRDALARHADCLLAMLLQAVACRMRHEALARVAETLLYLLGGTGRPPALTQAYLGELLGLRRTTVQAAAGELRRRGLIRYARGRITVLDAHGLEEAGCGCGRAVRAHYARVMPGAFA